MNLLTIYIFIMFIIVKLLLIKIVVLSSICTRIQRRRKMNNWKGTKSYSYIIVSWSEPFYGTRLLAVRVTISFFELSVMPSVQYKNVQTNYMKLSFFIFIFLIGKVENISSLTCKKQDSSQNHNNYILQILFSKNSADSSSHKHNDS